MNTKERSRLVKVIAAASKALGWKVLIPDVADDDDIPGLIIGTDEFCDTMTDVLEGARND